MSDSITTGFPSIAEGTARAPGRSLPRLRRSVLAALVLGVVAGVLAYLAWDVRAGKIRTITEGAVYQSGVLAPEALRDQVRRLGIRTVIDLRQPVEQVQGEKAVLSELGARHIHLPSAHIPEDDTVSRFLDIMSEPAVYPVLIHCEHGTGRSVLFSAIYRVEYEGWDREKARLATRSTIRWLFPGASFAVEAPKGAYLLNYAMRSRAADR